MTAIIIANSVVAAVTIFGLVVVCRTGHVLAGGRFDRRSVELDFRREAGREQSERLAA